MKFCKEIHKFIPGFRQLKANSMVIAATYYGAAAFILVKSWYWGLALLAAPFFLFNLLDLNAPRKGKPALLVAMAAGALLLLGAGYGMISGGPLVSETAAPPPDIVFTLAGTESPPPSPTPTPAPATAFPTIAPATASPALEISATVPASVPTSTVTVEPSGYAFYASKNSEVFHRPGCASVKKIKPANLTGFRTREEAVASGRRPCKNCKP